ncbi:MAG: hypothetical protein U0L58_04235 [Ruminococcus sp.]|nr:hypothetical protein [Ruminococcus sp.]
MIFTRIRIRQYTFGFAVAKLAISKTFIPGLLPMNAMKASKPAAKKVSTVVIVTAVFALLIVVSFIGIDLLKESISPIETKRIDVR